MNNSLKLLGDVVAVEFCEQDRIINGIHLPDDHIQNIRHAVVKFLGSQVTESSIEVGSRVIVTIYDALPKVKLNDTELRLYPTNKILALVLPVSP